MNKLTWIDTYNKATTKIQANYRGFATRKANKKYIDKAKDKVNMNLDIFKLVK